MAAVRLANALQAELDACAWPAELPAGVRAAMAVEFGEVVAEDSGVGSASRSVGQGRRVGTYGGALGALAENAAKEAMAGQVRLSSAVGWRGVPMVAR